MPSRDKPSNGLSQSMRSDGIIKLIIAAITSRDIDLTNKIES